MYVTTAGEAVGIMLESSATTNTASSSQPEERGKFPWFEMTEGGYQFLRVLDI